MSKRRTKKQKQNSKYNYVFKLLDEAKIDNFEPIVKGQFTKTFKAEKSAYQSSKKAEPSAKDIYLGKIRRDIKKSLIIVSLILALETMIYLVWR